MSELYLCHNRETARVRFLYKTLEDVDPVPIISDTDPDLEKMFGGEIEIRGQEYPIMRTCLQIPVFNVDLGCKQVWVRSIMSYHTLEQIYQKYPDAMDYVFKITRYGNQGDMGTRYTIECLGKDGCAKTDTSDAV